jgi:hypothetical protein
MNNNRNGCHHCHPHMASKYRHGPGWSAAARESSENRAFAAPGWAAPPSRLRLPVPVAIASWYLRWASRSGVRSPCAASVRAPTSTSISRSAAKAIISRRISASGAFSTSARKLIIRLQPFCHLHDCFGCFRLERLPGGACTHWNAPPCHGAHVKRTFRDGVADRLNSSSATPPGQAKTPPPICVVHWMSMSNFDIRCKIFMYPMRGSRWYDTKRRPASCLRPPSRNPRRNARICRRPCPRLRQDQPIRLVFDIITATAFIETGV